MAKDIEQKRKYYNSYANDMPRLFIVSNGPPMYLEPITIWRLMWRGGRQRAIFRTRFGAHRFLENFPEGCIIDVVSGICMDISKYNPEHVIIRLKYCRPNRRWIPNMMTLSPSETAMIDYWLEVDCEVEIVQEGIKI